MTIIHLLPFLLIAVLGTTALGEVPHTNQNVPIELTFHAVQAHEDPFNEVTLDVVFTDPSGVSTIVPAFWAGGSVWKVRYASGKVGKHSYRSVCSPKDAGLSDQQGNVVIDRFVGDNPLYRHGPIVVAKDKRHLQHADGTPFFWLGDTWWMGLAKRLHYPDEFQALAANRIHKGFNVVQIVAGLYPDMFPFDDRGKNEAGFPWLPEYAGIRPDYFDAADERIRYLVDQGLMPCIVGAWGYFLPWMGEEKMRQHWRYLIARYGAYPVVWCTAGEANLPWYLVKGFPFDDREQVHGWTHVADYIRKTDPFHRLLTIHPTAINKYTSRHAIDDAKLLDFDMLQTPHGRQEAALTTVQAMVESYHANPKVPVIDGEASYEMLSDSLPTRWTRAMFWICMMNGAAGHTYGANGIWQNNRPDDPHGRSPNGPGYGKITSEEAMNLPGSHQLGLGKALLEQYPWQKFEPHHEWASYEKASELNLRDSKWIWYREGNPAVDAPAEKRYFRRVFELPAKRITSARIKFSADDEATVWINGHQIGASKDWRAGAEFEIESQDLNAGKNVVAVRAANKPADVKQNPAGLICEMVVRFADGTSYQVRSDSAWRCSKIEPVGWPIKDLDDGGWPLSMELAPYGSGPWGRLAAEDDEPQCAGIPGKVRMVYCMRPAAVRLHGLRSGHGYRLKVFNPITGESTEHGIGKADVAGNLGVSPPAGIREDWLIIVEEGAR